MSAQNRNPFSNKPTAPPRNSAAKNSATKNKPADSENKSSADNANSASNSRDNSRGSNTKNTDNTPTASQAPASRVRPRPAPTSRARPKTRPSTTPSTTQRPAQSSALRNPLAPSKPPSRKTAQQPAQQSAQPTRTPTREAQDNGTTAPAPRNLRTRRPGSAAPTEPEQTEASKQERRNRDSNHGTGHPGGHGHQHPRNTATTSTDTRRPLSTNQEQAPSAETPAPPTSAPVSARHSQTQPLRTPHTPTAEPDDDEEDTFDQELEDLLGAEDDTEFDPDTQPRAPKHEPEHTADTAHTADDSGESKNAGDTAEEPEDGSDDDSTEAPARQGKLHPSTRKRLLREGQQRYQQQRPKTPTTEAQKRQGISKKRGYDKQRIIDKWAPKKHTQWGPTSTVRQRYKHHTDSGTVTGRQIQFYRNLNLTYTYDKNKVADLLAPPTDKQETKEQKVRRERLIRQAIGGDQALKRNSRLRITPKQIDDMRFLAIFRYANAKQISKKNAEREDTARRRLNRLRDRGLVLSNNIYGTKPVYFLSEEGMILSGYSYKTLMKTDINLSSLSHNFGINHIAACLHGANVDVLDFNGAFGDGTWPTRNRRRLDEKTMKYKYEYGEAIVSEYEIQSHLGRRRQNIKGEIYKPKAQADLKVALDTWKHELHQIKQNPDREEVKQLMRDHVFNSPEMIHENEWMWALFPHNPPTLMHHVPDLVIKRPRNPADGSPNSIAVELELNLKNSNDSYIKTLTAYKNDDKMFKEVVWISPSATIRNRIEKIAKDVGLWDTGKIRIIPLYYEHGEWTDNQMWFL